LKEKLLTARLGVASRRVEEAERERVWAIAAAHSSGLSIRKIAAATSLSSSRVHQLLHTDEAGEIPDWLSQLAKPEVGADERPVGKQTLPPILLASCIDADWQNWSPSCHRSRIKDRQFNRSWPIIPPRSLSSSPGIGTALARRIEVERGEGETLRKHRPDISQRIAT
jgi:hypothetical protein